MAQLNYTTTTYVSSFSIGLRSATEFDVEDGRLRSREVVMLGAPMVLVVLAVSATCCIILLRWKMRDRIQNRQSQNRFRDLRAESSQQQQTEGKYTHRVLKVDPFYRQI